MIYVIGQGLTLTIIGMTIVIVFLALLVLLMVVMSGIIRRIERRKAEAASGEAGGFAEAPPVPEEGAETEEAEAEDYSEIAAAVGAYLRAGGVLPAPGGDKREDVAAVLAALAAAGAPVPKGNYNEVAAAVAAIRAYK